MFIILKRKVGGKRKTKERGTYGRREGGKGRRKRGQKMKMIMVQEWRYL